MHMTIANTRRKPTGPATIAKRRNAVGWWTRLMATDKRPKGPKLNEITDEHLIQFRSLLESATFRRSANGIDRPLAAFTKKSIVDEVMVVIAAAGPKNKSSIRAELLTNPPHIYIEKLPAFPKITWSIDEAKQVARGLLTVTPHGTWTHSVEWYRKLSIAWLCLLVYTGHRASTYRILKASDLLEFRPGYWVIDVAKSVKTGKPDRIPVHRRLLKSLNDLGERAGMIEWPISYRSLFNHFKAWQRHAGLPEKRIISPQAMRRFHAQELQRTGFTEIEKMASSSLGHSSTAMTAGHYSNARDLAVLSLPDLWEDAA